MTYDPDYLHPYKPGDWVMTTSGRVAKVRSVDYVGKELTLDLVIYSKDGEKIGRESPAMGGPRSYEPCCSPDGWERCRKPDFPLSPKWVTQPDGSRTAMYWSERLPPANWKRPAKRPTPFQKWLKDEQLRALEQIAAGHNDPRALAQSVLKR